MQSSRPYARHSVAPTDVNLLKVGTDDAFWVPTVVNPAIKGDMVQKTLFWTHIGVWVVALILSCISNFGASGLQAKTDNSTCTGGLNETANCFADDPTTSTITIGVIGGISSILGVVALLGGSSMFEKEAFRTQVWLNVAIQFLTLYGTVCTFFVWAKAAEKDATGAFWLGLFANIFMLYAQVLLYCTSATLDVMALPRAFIPCFAVSVQLVSAIAIQGGDWHYGPGMWTHDNNHFTAGQKFAAWMVPVFMATSIFLMVALRRVTRDVVTEISELGDYPFIRSLVLFPFMISGLLAVYKLSFVKADPDPTGFMFALLGMLLNFSIISVVFVPSGMSSSAVPTPNLRASSGEILGGKEYSPSDTESRFSNGVSFRKA